MSNFQCMRVFAFKKTKFLVSCMFKKEVEILNWMLKYERLK